MKLPGNKLRENPESDSERTRLGDRSEVTEKAPEIVGIESREEFLDHDVVVVLEVESDVVARQVEFQQDPVQFFAGCFATLDRFGRETVRAMRECL